MVCHISIKQQRWHHNISYNYYTKVNKVKEGCQLGYCYILYVLFYYSKLTEDPCGLAAVDLVFVVDASTSVKEENFKKQLDFMKTIVNYADIDSGNISLNFVVIKEKRNVEVLPCGCIYYR